MVSQIGTAGVSQIQMLNALNAFKADTIQKPSSELMPEVPEGINLIDNNDILKNLDLAEVKQFAKTAGEENLSEDDIKYGLTYGRSVIADYMI